MNIYTVKQGDSLYAIAQEFGVSEQSLIAANQLDYPDRLVVGQALVIESEPIVYEVRQGDSLYSISQRFGVTIPAILRANPEISYNQVIYPRQIIRIPSVPAYQRRVDVNGYAYPFITDETLSATLPFLTFISIFSYSPRPNGSLIPINDNGVIATAKQRQVAPLMVLTNFDESGNFSSELASEILRNPYAQDVLLNNIIRVMEEKGYYGLDVDFEYIARADRRNYVAFLEKTVQRLHPLGYQVSTALAAKDSLEQEGPLTEGVDYRAIGEIVDMVLIMTYDWGYKYGPPMAVSPYNKVDQAIAVAVSEIPHDKVLMGMPNYGYDWPLPYTSGVPASLIMNREAVNLAVNTGSEIRFDETAKSPYFYYNRSGRQHVVWFDDARSFQAKLGLIEKYRLRGMGYWNINTLFLPGWLVLNSMYNVNIGKESPFKR